MKQYKKHKCKTDEFWRENVFRRGIQNWIKQKYNYDTIVKIVNKNIIIQFKGTESYEYKKIIKEICTEYNMQIRYIIRGCQKVIKDQTFFKTYIYELEGKK